MVINIATMTRRKARSMTPPLDISHSVQLGVGGWGGRGGSCGEAAWGSGGEVGSDDGAGSVEKALTALQGLQVSVVIALTFQ